MLRFKRRIPARGVRAVRAEGGPDQGATVIHVNFRSGLRPSAVNPTPRSFPAMVLDLCQLADKDKITLSIMQRLHDFEVVLGADEPIPFALLAMIRHMLGYIPCGNGKPHIVVLERCAGWEAGELSSRNPEARTYTARFEFSDAHALRDHHCFASTTEGPCTIKSAAISFVRRDGTSAHPNKETSGITIPNQDYIALETLMSHEA